ncbi:MAG TPA: tail fiber protein [Allosphingosinicella sp.]|jgi:microcystin-dependent protein
MSEPFLGEIRLFAINFPPRGWAFCNGQQMQINQNQALFSLLGTAYGGNGQTTFFLPNLRGRVPIHTSQNHTIGEAAGSSSVTITQQQLPQHVHFMSGKAAQAAVVGGAVPANTKSLAQAIASTGTPATPVNIYSTAGPQTALNAASVTNTGGSQAHNNMMPYLVLNFCIALQGIFPSRN